MRRGAKATLIIMVGVAALGTVAAVAGPLVYRDFFAPPAAEVPTLTATDSALLASPSEPLAPEALSGEWIISAGSVAGYRVSEVLGGVDVEVTGRTDEVTGTIVVSDLTLEAAAFTVDMASIATDEPARDQYFRTTALRVDEFPTASFRLTQPVTVAELPAPGETFESDLTGDLTIAGVTQSVTFVAIARTDGSTTEIAGQIPIVFSDFGVTAPDLNFVRVEDAGFVDFQLVVERG